MPKQRDGPTVDISHFHAILLGTGLTNTIVGSSLAKSSHNLLHLDLASEYGSHQASLNLNSFKTFLQNNSGDGGSSSESAAAPTEDEIVEWREITNDTEGQYEYQPVNVRSTFFGGKWKDFTETPIAAAATTASQPPAEAQSDSPTESAPSSSSDGATPAESATLPAVAAAPSFPPLDSEGRRYSIDLTPQLIFSRSPLIDLLVAGGIHNYVEFKAVDSSYLANNVSSTLHSVSSPLLHPLPLSKSSIFQTTTLSMLEKRVLMKFMHLVLGDDYHQTLDETQKQARTLELSVVDQAFIDFLKSQKLSTTLIQMVLYAVAMLDESLDSVGSVPASIGIDRLRTYLSSVGRYGPGAFLYPNYGVSELPQAFARLAAVNRGIFILRTQPEAIVYQRRKEEEDEARVYKGIIMPSGQFLTSDALVSEIEYRLTNDNSSQSAGDDDCTFLARATLILDGPLVTGGSTSIPLSNSSSFVLSPASPNESPVYGLQLGWEVSATPRGRTIVYLWTTGEDRNTSEENIVRLESLASNMTRSIDSIDRGENEKPRLLAIGTYQQRLPKRREGVTAVAQASNAPPAVTESTEPNPSSSSSIDGSTSGTDTTDTNASEPLAPPLPRLLLRVEPASSSLAFGLDRCLADAESIFRQLCPDRSFHATMQATRPDEHDDTDMAILEQIQPTQQVEGGEEDGGESTSAPESTNDESSGDATTTTATNTNDAIETAT